LTTYKIVRHYADSDKASEDIPGLSGLTLSEAQKHCKDPSTHKPGEWFDGYTQESDPLGPEEDTKP